MSNDATVIDDHTSDDALQYTGSWTHLLGISDAVNNTLSYTTEVGATVEFKFNGTGVGVVGAVAAVNGSDSPVSSYILDGASPVVFTAPSNITNTQYSQTFFLQQSLSTSSEHTLVINVTRTSGAAPFLYDYIGYIPLSSPTASSSVSISSGLPSASPSSSGNDNSKSSTPVGAIVGGVIGGLALLVAIVFGGLFLRSKRRDRGPYHDGVSNTLNQEAQDHTKAPLMPSQQGPEPYRYSALPAHITGASPVQHPQSTPNLGGDGAGVVSPPQPWAPAATVQEIQREPDALSDIPDDVPPQYTEH